MNDLTISDYLPISGHRICSIGNRWHHNFGDELILVGLIKLLSKNSLKSKDQILHISCWDIPFLKWFLSYFFTKQEFDSYITFVQEIPHGLRSWVRFLFRQGSVVGHPKRSSLLSIWNYLSCDTFIVGGWELFTEETPGSYLYRFWSLLPYRIRKIFFWNTKLYLMGGFQQPSSRYNRSIAWLITKCADGCYMRDEESVQDILAIHPGKKHVEWFIDTSYFALDTMRPKDEDIKIPDNDAERLKGEDAKMVELNGELRIENWEKHIIINSNPLSWKRTDELIDITKDYINKWYNVYFLPAFFTSNPQQDDMKVYDYLKKDIHNLKLLDRRNRDEFQIIFHSAEKIFCSRLHVFLISSFLWLDVQAYPYQKKINKNMSILKRCWILK